VGRSCIGKRPLANRYCPPRLTEHIAAVAVVAVVVAGGVEEKCGGYLRDADTV